MICGATSCLQSFLFTSHTSNFSKVIDYIVVGLGLSGISFCHQLQKQQHSFVVIDNGKQSASSVGSGLFNPIALKRTKPAWMGHQLMSNSMPTYKVLEIELGVRLIHHASILKIIHQKADINDWHQASVQDDCKPYMNPNISKIETWHSCSTWFWRGDQHRLGGYCIAC